MSAEWDDLPEELLEHVFLHLLPYGEIQTCRKVNRKWRRLANGALERLRILFLRCSDFEWALLQPQDEPLGPGGHGVVANIAERCSHAAVFHEDSCSLFVFGGCTLAYTTFNDLWRFDLQTRRWVRPQPIIGSHPTPKACATLVNYKGQLVLFGGWSKSSPNPIHQTAMFFNELHLFDPDRRSWSHVVDPRNSAPHLAGHAATVIDDSMIVFGGSHGSGSSNRVWVYNFITSDWFTPHTETATSPLPRYGHTQILVDSRHILVIGGCGGPNLIFSDVWLLTLDLTEEEFPWRWDEIRVANPALAPPQIWSHPGCRVGDNVVFLSKPLQSRPGPERLFREMSTRSGHRVEPLNPPGSSRNVADHPNPDADGPHPHSSQRGWVPPSANLIPPRRRVLISSKSLDEKAPPPSPRLGEQGAHEGELHRARSIPAIIVGEIPKLVVTEDNNASANQGALGAHPATTANGTSSTDTIGQISPSAALNSEPMPAGSLLAQQQPATTQCIALAASSLLPNQAVPVTPPPISPSATEPRPATASTSSGHTLHRNTPYPSVKPNAMKNRVKQLEMLRRMEEYIARSRSSGGLGSDRSSNSSSREGSQSPGESLRFRPSSPPPSGAAGHPGAAQQRVLRPSRNPMHMYLMDLRRVLDPADPSVTWSVDAFSCYEAPEDTILFSLSKGRGELVLFGGMRSASSGSGQGNLDVTPFCHTITNETYIIRPNTSFR